MGITLGEKICLMTNFNLVIAKFFGRINAYHIFIQISCYSETPCKIIKYYTENNAIENSNVQIQFYFSKL